MIGAFILTAVRRAPLLTGGVLVAAGQALSALVCHRFPKRMPLELADVTSVTLTAALTALHYATSAQSARQKLIGGAVVAWAARLAVFLTRRVRGGFHDARLDRFRGSAAGARAWAVAQTVWVGVILLPVWVGMSGDAVQPGLNALDAVCGMCAAGGLAIAHVADRQKAAFLRENRARPREQQKPFCDVGLFRRSRFPNYFGEWLMWAAVSVAAFQTAGVPRARLLLPACPYVVLQIFYKLCMPLAFKSVRKRATQQQLEDWLRISEFVPSLRSAK